MIRAVSLTGCVQLPQGVSHEKKAGSRYGAPQRIARNPAVGRQKTGFPSGDEPLLAAALVGRNYNLRLPTLTQPSTWLEQILAPLDAIAAPMGRFSSDELRKFRDTSRCSACVHFSGSHLWLALLLMNEELNAPGLDVIVPDITKACPMFFPWPTESAPRVDPTVARFERVLTEQSG